MTRLNQNPLFKSNTKSKSFKHSKAERMSKLKRQESLTNNFIDWFKNEEHS